MGVSMDSSFQPVEVLAERSLPVPVLADVEKLARTNRPDLKRIQSEEAAQRQSVAMAKSAFGPRLNAFAGWRIRIILLSSRAVAAITGWAEWRCNSTSSKVEQK